jgi:Fe-S cluster assembly ATP-binding protein
MLTITDLCASVGDKEILKGLSLEIKPGEVHAIMGVNGSGKSTLANVLTGKSGYEVTNGTVQFEGQDLLDLEPCDRARAGIFLAFQYPVELPGVLTSYFLRTAYNSMREARNLPTAGVREFQKILKEKTALIKFNEDFLKRSVNEGFSGGEKKRSEIFQMAILDPKLAILDETDSGLDIDALQIVADGVNQIKKDDPQKSFLIITHYQRLLNFIEPDFVHVMIDGKIVRTGGKELALELEERGYQWIRDTMLDATVYC